MKIFVKRLFTFPGIILGGLAVLAFTGCNNVSAVKYSIKSEGAFNSQKKFELTGNIEQNFENANDETVETVKITSVPIEISAYKCCITDKSNNNYSVNDLTIYSDSEGDWAAEIVPLIPLWDYDRKELLDKIKKNKVVSEFKGEIASLPYDTIEKGIIKKHYKVKIKTKLPLTKPDYAFFYPIAFGQQAPDFKVLKKMNKNIIVVFLAEDESSFEIFCPSHELQETIDKGFSNLVKGFVQERINPKVQECKISIFDIETHGKISDSDITIEVNVPEKSKILADFFTGSLLKKSQEFISPYTIGKTTAKLTGNSIKKNIMVPYSTIKIKINRKRYHPFSATFKLTNSSLNKNVFLTDRRFQDRSKIENEIEK